MVAKRDSERAALARKKLSPQLREILLKAEVSQYTIRRLPSAGLTETEDLLWWLPLRYEDRRQPIPISKVKEDTCACLKVRLASLRSRRGWRGRVAVTEGIVNDDSGSLHVIWFNQPWLGDTLEKGEVYLLYGRINRYSTRSGFRLQLENPVAEQIESESSDPVHIDRIVPIYSRAGSLKSKALRTMFYQLFESGIQIDEVLPAGILSETGMVSRDAAFREVHFPDEDTTIKELVERTTMFQKRLIFDELLALQWGTALAAKERENLKGVEIRKISETGDFLRKLLPFHLTTAQKRVLKEIVDDLSSDKPMYRLLHGDVGSGKTIIAFLAMLMAAHQGYQAVFLAPTEVLARQQFLKLSELGKKGGLKVEFLASSVKGKERTRVLESLLNGESMLVVGTHSVFQEEVVYKNLGLVVIDEQHRFGVEQRARLVSKGANPNVMVMSATPIPRSLALTLYGDLDLSVIDELPPGRKEIRTVIRDEEARRKLEQFVRDEMDRGGQVFYVYPLVDESDTVKWSAARDEYERLRRGAYRGYKTALLYGSMKAEEKEKVMDRVRSGMVQLLVATTVVELGVDLPDASAIVIENAERFGLAQLHQLRGRVGRGKRKSICVLMHSEEMSENGLERLKVLENTTDGFEIAEADLRLRGPGDFGGVRQWGGGSFKIANPLRDHEVMARAREVAARLASPGYPWEGNEKEVFDRWVEGRNSLQGSFGRIG